MAISMDMAGPLPVGRSGSRYITCIIDHLTRWGEANILIASTSNAVVKILRDWVERFDKPCVVFVVGLML